MVVCYNENGDTMENQKQIIMLQHFFEADMRMKKEMLKIAPPDDSGFIDQDSLIKYTDAVEDFLIYTFSELKCIALDLFGDKSNALNKITELEKKTKKDFYKCGLDIQRLRNFYKSNISDMDPDFINLVKDTCQGYTTIGDVSALKYCRTLNEALHFFHSYIMNNEVILQSIPETVSKENINGELICLRGTKNEFFESVYSKFPTSLNVGFTDLVIINERKMLIMVRDRGHALTIEITINNNTARIEYFIPKICNIDMVNALPGINKVGDNSIGATGIVEVPAAKLPEFLFYFIEKVPTDSDAFNKSTIEKQI